MTTLNISFNLDLKDDEAELLEKIIGKIDERETFEVILSRFAKASFEEYCQMFLGNKVFTRGIDIREYRLLLIITHALNGEIPSEEYVSKLFQLTPSSSRSLIRSAVSKYQHELEQLLHKYIKQIIDDAEPDDEKNPTQFTIDTKSPVLIEEINKILGNIDSNAVQITKKPKTYSKWVVEYGSYIKLADHFNIDSEYLRERQTQQQ